MRVAGVDIPDSQVVAIGLTKIYGIGRRNALAVLSEAKVAAGKRVKDLTSEEVAKIQKGIETKYKIEGDLRKEVQDNVARLKRINSYRGRRHAANLPVRGQRTRTNARTKRGKRVTIGALKKEVLAKIETAAKENEK